MGIYFIFESMGLVNIGFYLGGKEGEFLYFFIKKKKHYNFHGDPLSRRYATGK